MLSPAIWRITWTEFPEVIEVSIQMSIISSKYIQVSIVGNYTQQGKDSNELILVQVMQNEQTMIKCN